MGEPRVAAAGVVGRPVAVCAAPATTAMTARRAFADAAAFDCKTPQARFGPGDFWLRSELLPADLPADEPIAVRTTSVWQRAMTLYALYPDGQVVVSRANDRGIARSIQLGAIVERRLPDRGMRPIRLVWHIEGAANVRGVLIGVRLATPAESARSNLFLGALYAAFGGFALALLAHNLALWRALRQRFQLYYIGMLLALIGYALSSSGALAWAGVDFANTLRLRANYLTLALAAAAAVGFARNFFEARIFAGWLGRAATAVSVAMVGAGVAYTVLAPWQIGLLDRIYAFSFLSVAAVIFPMLWRAWRLRSDYRWLFGIAWAAPIVLGAMRVAYNFGGLRWNFWIDNSTLISMAGEALIFQPRDRLPRASGRARPRRGAGRGDRRAAARRYRPADRTAQPPRVPAQRDRPRGGPAAADPRHRPFQAGQRHHRPRRRRRSAAARRARCCAALSRRRAASRASAARNSRSSRSRRDRARQPAACSPACATTRMPFDIHRHRQHRCVRRAARPTKPTWKSLYRAADRALFDAKAAGRDRARRAGDRVARAARPAA